MDRFVRNPLKKLGTLARVMLGASILACAFGCFQILNCIHDLNISNMDGILTGPELAPVISELAEGAVLAVHYFFVSKFFFHAIRKGVPFTREAAREIKILGYETILLPVIAWVISAIAYRRLLSASMVFGMSVYEVALGFALIIISYMVEYGTEKIEAGHRGHQAIRYIMEHYPEVANEAKAAMWEEGVDFPDNEVFSAELVKKKVSKGKKKK